MTPREVLESELTKVDEATTLVVLRVNKDGILTISQAIANAAEFALLTLYLQKRFMSCFNPVMQPEAEPA